MSTRNNKNKRDITVEAVAVVSLSKASGLDGRDRFTSSEELASPVAAPRLARMVDDLRAGSGCVPYFRARHSCRLRLTGGLAVLTEFPVTSEGGYALAVEGGGWLAEVELSVGVNVSSRTSTNTGRASRAESTRISPLSRTGDFFLPGQEDVEGLCQLWAELSIPGMQLVCER
jgi:hypothetical protein